MEPASFSLLPVGAACRLSTTPVRTAGIGVLRLSRVLMEELIACASKVVVTACTGTAGPGVKVSALSQNRAKRVRLI